MIKAVHVGQCLPTHSTDNASIDETRYHVLYKQAGIGYKYPIRNVMIDVGVSTSKGVVNH